MRIPKIIEAYYTKRLFQLIQACLKGKGITVTEPNQIGGIASMQRIGNSLTMYIKEERICSYSDMFEENGFWFYFNRERVNVDVPTWIVKLAPVFFAWDQTKAFIKSLYIKYWVCR